MVRSSPGASNARPTLTGSAPRATARSAASTTKRPATAAAERRRPSPARVAITGAPCRPPPPAITPSPVQLPEQPQAGEGEVVVHRLDGRRLRCDEARQAAGGDHPGGTDLGGEPRAHAVDEARVAVDDAALHRVDGVPPHHARGERELDAVEARGAGEERFGADLDAGADDPAEVFALRGDAIEGRRRAEVDAHHRVAGARPRVGGDRVDDA